VSTFLFSLSHLRRCPPPPSPLPSPSPPKLILGFLMAPVADFKQGPVVSGVRSSPSKSKPAEGGNTSTSTNGHKEDFRCDSMEDALQAFARGEFLVVMDDEGRENEGDLIIAASQCTTEKMAWMIKHTRYVLLCPAQYIPSLNTEGSQWLHLYRTSQREARRAGDPDDGSAERGSSPNRLYNHSRLQTWCVNHFSVNPPTRKRLTTSRAP